MGKPLLTFTSPGSHAGLTTFLFTNIYFWQTTHTKTRKPNGSLPSPRLSKTFFGHSGVTFQYSTESYGQYYQHLLKSFRVKYQLSGSWTVFNVMAHFPQTILQLMILPLNLTESSCCIFLRKCLNPH